MHSVVFVLGPTAAGKSNLALTLAQRLGGAILNCDSLQVYRRLDIGTAKPSPAEQALVPHFLFDQLGPGEVLTAGDFRRLALDVCARELPSQTLFAVGGSGFYIQAFEKGMFEVEKASAAAENVVRERLERHGAEFMYQELERLDPDYAKGIHPGDTYRVTRALIVIEDSGRKMSELKNSFKPQKFPYDYIKLGLSLDREALLPRVKLRTRKMLDEGLLNEVRALVDEGWSSWPPLQSVGYKECLDHLSGRLPGSELEAKIVEKTLQLAKKQRTWFKRDAEIHWLNADDPTAEAIDILTRRSLKA